MSMRNRFGPYLGLIPELDADELVELDASMYEDGPWATIERYRLTDEWRRLLLWGGIVGFVACVVSFTSFHLVLMKIAVVLWALISLGAVLAHRQQLTVTPT